MGNEALVEAIAAGTAVNGTSGIYGLLGGIA
jgi:hypothetical protein